MVTYKKYVNLSALGLAIMLCTGCASQRMPSNDYQPTEVVTVVTDQSTARTAPGIVEYVWEEPMTDVVDVPPGLDPEGHYYRPGHQEIREIRQGRWNYYRGGVNN